ncbi:TetR/AcrR family transcriptional regulator [Nocardia cyriacigeorgica]|uniref:TetR/AcrR family transcriptional regulator n=1 Tax=Nocardia cyriacigeorgica TaxID=135487 RepID=UPI0018939A1E|nr:TetR/AcrR family transcriptional regulator [Nocardia cyriacigeorgica]MBF6319213.1 TetR/AcrR family transcriptional regulator [Nocardia cyriacigeorgica]MBF6531276.1 TetR/AcrR family transcriptional regulator [Nocardia cyriacigeorgica]
MTSPARNRQGDATRLRLITTAERLFATHGVDAVSVRAINAAAGLGAASVHYHFGSKDELLAAVLVELGAPVRDRIRANAGLLADAPHPPDAESLVRAVTTPYLELLQRHRTRGMRWIKIIAQIAPQGHPALAATDQQLPEVLFAQVRRAFPEADPQRLAARWAVSVMGFVQALSQADEWSRDGDRLSPEELVTFYEDVVTFVIGGVERLLPS